MSKRIRLKTIRTVILCLIVLVTGFGVGYYSGLTKAETGTVSVEKILANTQKPEDYQEVDFSLFWDVWRLLEREYIDPDKIDTEKMVYGAVQGMVASLEDPYTVFLPPEDQQRTQEDLSGAFEGVGIQLGYIDRQLAVIAPLKGTPAEEAGVQAGDYILNIKDDNKGIDIETAGMSLPQAVAHIRGEHNMPVTLTMYRDGELQPFDVTIYRDTIVIPSVELEIVEASQSGNTYAHLILSRFGGRTEQEWNQAVNQIVANDQVDGVVLDVRNNPGGYLDGAIFVASEFMNSGLIVSQKGRLVSQDYTVNRVGKLTDIPLAILVNRGSASASEIVAGALRDQRNVPLIGSKTFGKGTVQSSETIRDNMGIHITTSRWMLPSGDWIHETGLEVDIEATDSAETIEVDEVLQTAFDYLDNPD